MLQAIDPNARRGQDLRPLGQKDSNNPFHVVAIPHMGLTLGEIFLLEELAADCAADVLTVMCVRGEYPPAARSVSIPEEVDRSRPLVRDRRPDMRAMVMLSGLLIVVATAPLAWAAERSEPCLTQGSPDIHEVATREECERRCDPGFTVCKNNCASAPDADKGKCLNACFEGVRGCINRCMNSSSAPLRDLTASATEMSAALERRFDTGSASRLFAE